MKEKLKEKHNIEIYEVVQCTDTLERKFLEDDREQHRTDPATLWFISETYRHRLLKVVFVQVDNNIYIKTAYDPNEVERKIYEQHG